MSDLTRRGRLEATLHMAAFAAVLAAFIGAEAWIGARAASAALYLFAFAVMLTQTLAGSLALRAAGLDDIEARLPTAFCTGFACLTLPMYALIWLLDVSALHAFAVCAGIVWLVALGGSRRSGAPLEAPGAGRDILATLVLALAIVALTRVPVASARTLETLGVLPIWIDYYLHGITISSFGGPFAMGTEMELPGVARVFYHYAPFMLPAAFQPVIGASGLALATSLLLPLGLLSAALGGYALATRLGGGRAVGLLCVVVAMAVPAYRLPLQSGWLDFHWMLMIAPGSGYALGLSMVVCIAAIRYVEHGSARLLLFTALLLASIILVRVHFFMLLAPAIVLFLALRHRRAHARKMLVALCTVTILLAALIWATPPLRDWYLAMAQPTKYLDLALQFTQAYGRKLLLPETPAAPMLVAKTLLVLAAVLGVHLLAYPLLALGTARRLGLQRTDLLAPLVVASFVGLMLLMPAAGNSDFTEYKHRHFPLVYALVAMGSVAYAARLAAASLPGSGTLSRIAIVLALAVLAIATWAGRGSNPAHPDTRAMPWSEDFHDKRAPPGLLNAAKYLKAHAQEGDILAMGGDAISGQSQMLVELVALTDIPAFLARADLRMLREPCVQRTVEMRMAALKAMDLAPDWPAAQRLMRDNAIRWFLVPAGAPASWDPNGQAAVLKGTGMSIYDAGEREPGTQPPTQPCRALTAPAAANGSP